MEIQREILRRAGFDEVVVNVQNVRDRLDGVSATPS